MSNVIAVNDALASAIFLAKKALKTNQNLGIGIIPVQKRIGCFQLILAENRGGALVTLMNKQVRAENLGRHVNRIRRTLRVKAKSNPYSDPVAFREDVYGGKGDFLRSWRSVDPKTRMPLIVGDSVIIVPYNPT